MRYIRRLVAVFLVAIVCLFMFIGGVSVNEQKAEKTIPQNFFEMSIEELMQVEIAALEVSPEDFFEMSIEELMEVEIAIQADYSAVVLPMAA